MSSYFTFLKRISLITMLSLSAIALPSIAAETTNTISPPTLEALAGLPNFTTPRLSPSGQKIAYLKDVKGRRTLIVQGFDSPDKIAIPPWDDKIEYVNFFWKNENYIIFTVRAIALSYGKKRQMTRLISLNLTNKQVKWLGKPEKKSKGERPSLYETVVHELPNDEKHMLVTLRLRGGGDSSVYKVNIVNGHRNEHVFRRKHIRLYFADHTGEVRFGLGFNDLQKTMRFVLRNSAGKWIDLKGLDWADDYEVRGFSENPDQVYVVGQNKKQRRSLYLMDIKKGEIVKTLFEHDTYDIDSIEVDQNTGKLKSLNYISDARTEVLFDPNESTFVNAIANSIKAPVTIAHKARDTARYILLAGKNNEPGYYLLFDQTKKKLIKLTDRQTGISAANTYPVSQIQIPARDGELIPSILTRPSTDISRNLPAVIMPHGGPTSRSKVTWDALAQFLASRGYLVLQPNFRGSIGYGRAFTAAGENQWGGVMQTDVVDTTQWLIEQGMIDQNRICIMGASYGGYAATLATVMTPDLYQCAISTNGVHNFPAMMSRDLQYQFDTGWSEIRGLEGKDDKFISPYHRAEEITTPILLVASKDDPRVPYKQSQSFYKKLKKLNKPVSLITLKDDGHGFLTTKSRLKQFREIEKFLAEHLN